MLARSRLLSAFACSNPSLAQIAQYLIHTIKVKNLHLAKKNNNIVHNYKIQTTIENYNYISQLH